MRLKELFKKTVEATGDSIGNKIASMDKLKGKTMEVEGIYILPEKR